MYRIEIMVKIPNKATKNLLDKLVDGFVELLKKVGIDVPAYCVVKQVPYIEEKK